jgi:NitT/TauT family transport system ATP-binding protein
MCGLASRRERSESMLTPTSIGGPMPEQVAVAPTDRAGAPVLEKRSLNVTYGKDRSAVEAIRDVSFTVRKGEFLCVVGPSGCGKTTLLKSIAGLLKPTGGTVEVEGTQVDGPPRDQALVFQEYTRSLFPWLTVRKNVTFPLVSQGLGKAEQRAQADEALAEVGLLGFEDKYPWQLSGGMQQRVAIARAIAYQPAVMLMDEPFASVDAQTRSDLEDLMLRVHRDTGVTVLFVTHDIDEAVYLGHRVLVLSARPTTVRAAIEIPLPTPRDQITTRASPEFVVLRTRILKMIKGEQTDEDSDENLVAFSS